jgi:protein tyrosine/serine phosphatase
MVLTLLATSSLISAAYAGDGQSQRESQTANRPSIENFGKVNDHLYRGSQPKGDDFRSLAAYGVKTIVDLRGDSERAAKSEAESAGLRYINLGMTPKQYPLQGTAERFLQIVNDQANWPVYVHCAGGRHRTGAMVAVYRMSVDGWDVERAYQEMKVYDFYTKMGHGCYKEFVFDYSQRLQTAKQPSYVSKAAPDGNPVMKMTSLIERPFKRLYRAKPF